MKSLDFKEVFARYFKPYWNQYGHRIPKAHLKAAQAILGCRTAAMGGALYQCGDCGALHYAYHSCNHRNCPLCGHQASVEWAAKQKAKLLPVPYSMITFTVPESIRRVFRSNQELCYKLFFQCTARALKEVAADPKYLGAAIGFLGVLHTWTRQLEYHPHIHYIMPEGGLTTEGAWVRFKQDGFLPVRKLSIKTRLYMEEAVREEAPELFALIPRSVWREAWTCHRQAVGSGEHAIEYLSRYVTQTALSSKRIVADDGTNVTIQYTESGTGLTKYLTLSGVEFIRRFLQHVLPTGFKRVRYYGWLSPAAHKRFDRILALLDWQRGPLPEKEQRARCRLCEGLLHLLDTWNRGRAPPYMQAVALEMYPNEPKAPQTSTRASA